jgi:glutamate racemase
MLTPVTRGEFAQFEIRLEQRLSQLVTKAEIAQLATKAEIAQLATKVELEIWGGALLARLLERIDSSDQRLLAELARHTKASSEDMSTQISVIDEKYADLPHA